MSGARAKVLLVDDDPGLLRLISLRLEAAGHDVDTASSAQEALGRIASSKPGLVITDLRMDGMDGMDLFRNLREQMPTLPVIIMTAHGTIPDAVAATREGAFAFLTKPFDSEELLRMVAEAIGHNQSDPTPDAPGWRAGIIFRSQAMEAVLAELELIAESEASVMICGESGSGKELIARAIHAASRRADRPFVALNCAAIPADLLESELFGYRKGAFTGAESHRDGLFVQADGGTLFLDEVADMPESFQAKLLRALQEQRVRPLGAAGEVEVDVRVLSATHHDVEAAIQSGKFREDLFYRLNVVQLEVPPLRDRPEDIPVLAEHFLIEVQRQMPADKRIKSFSPDALRLLVQSELPGNVRQLRNIVEHVCALCRAGPIPANLVRRALRQDNPEMTPFSEARADFERNYLVRVLRMAGGSVSEAARLASRNRTEFYRLLKRHHIDPADFKR